jgi:transcriptional regulator with XRE-family HTH domain
MNSNPLGDFIRDRRSALGWSQRDFASRAGISNSYVANIERGYDHATGKPTNPSMAKMTQIAAALRVPVAALSEIARGKDPSMAIHIAEALVTVFPERMNGVAAPSPSSTPNTLDIPDDTPYPPDEWEIEAVKRLRSADPLDNAYDPTQKRSFWYIPKADRKRRLRSRINEMEEDLEREEGQA